MVSDPICAAKKNGRVLQPVFSKDALGRSLIRSHSCLNPFGPSKGPKKFCSEGCVTGTPTDIKKLNKLIDAEPSSMLIVVP